MLDAAENAAKTWVVEAVPLEADSTVLEVSMALDSQGRAHCIVQLAPTNTAEQKLVYAVRDANGWRTQQLATGVHAFPKVVVDPWDGVHVGYLWLDAKGAYASQAKYVHFEADGPHYEDVATTPTGVAKSAPFYDSLDFYVDDLHRVHLAASRTDGSLAYSIRKDDGKWVGPVDPSAFPDTGPTAKGWSNIVAGSAKVSAPSLEPTIVALRADVDNDRLTPVALRLRGELGWHVDFAPEVDASLVAFSMDRNNWSKHLLTDDAGDYRYVHDSRTTQTSFDSSVTLEGPSGDVDPALAMALDKEGAAHVVVIGPENMLQYGRIADGQKPTMSTIPLETRTWERDLAIAADAKGPRILATDNVDSRRLKYVTLR